MFYKTLNRFKVYFEVQIEEYIDKGVVNV